MLTAQTANFQLATVKRLQVTLLLNSRSVDKSLIPLAGELTLFARALSSLRMVSTASGLRLVPGASQTILAIQLCNLCSGGSLHEQKTRKSVRTQPSRFMTSFKAGTTYWQTHQRQPDQRAKSYASKYKRHVMDSDAGACLWCMSDGKRSVCRRNCHGWRQTARECTWHSGLLLDVIELVGNSSATARLSRQMRPPELVLDETFDSSNHRVPRIGLECCNSSLMAEPFVSVLACTLGQSALKVITLWLAAVHVDRERSSRICRTKTNSLHAGRSKQMHQRLTALL